MSDKLAKVEKVDIKPKLDRPARKKFLAIRREGVALSLVSKTEEKTNAILAISPWMQKVDSVDGLALAGKTEVLGNVRGIAIATMNEVKGNVHGMVIGGISEVEGETNGVTAGFFAGTKKTNGLMCCVINDSDAVNGMAIGWKNEVANVNGVIFGARNDSENSAIGYGNGLSLGLWNSGIQINGVNLAVVNNTSFVNGVSIGLITSCMEGSGLNIGAVNTIEEFNGVSIAFAGNLCETFGSDNGIIIGGILNLLSIDTDVNGVICSSLLNICGKLNGLMLGLINIINGPSTGIQIGLLNIRIDAQWYAKVIPGIAIRFAGLKEWLQTRRYYRRFAEIIDKSNEAETVRQMNRNKLLHVASEGQPPQLLPPAVYREGLALISSDSSEEFEHIRTFVLDKKLADKKRIEKISSDLTDKHGKKENEKDCELIRNKRKEAAEELAAISSDPDVYGNDASQKALKELIMVATRVWNVGIPDGKKEAIEALALLGISEDDLKHIR